MYVLPSVNPLIVAVDSDFRAQGHLTFYPSDQESVALQIPFKDGKVPEHTVLHEGACRGDEGEGGAGGYAQQDRIAELVRERGWVMAEEARGEGEF